jgi:phosphoglycolate phosphatase
VARTKRAGGQPRLASIPSRIAFDLDGTLIDARARQVAVARDALVRATGEELDQARFWRRKRAGATTLEALRGLGYPAATAEPAARRWGERIEADEWLACDRALPGVARRLGEVRGAGSAIMVITARRRPAGARRSVAAAGLAPLIDDLIVVDPRDAVAAKARALRECGAAAFIGDTDSDGAASRSAGVPFVAVSTGQRSAGYLRARGYEVTGSLRAALARLTRVT